MKNNNKLQRVIKLNKAIISKLKNSGGGGLVGQVNVGNTASCGVPPGGMVQNGRILNNNNNLYGGCWGGTQGCGGGTQQAACNTQVICSDSCDNVATCYTCEENTCTCPVTAPTTDTNTQTNPNEKTVGQQATCNQWNNCVHDISNALFCPNDTGGADPPQTDWGNGGDGDAITCICATFDSPCPSQDAGYTCKCDNSNPCMTQLGCTFATCNPNNPCVDTGVNCPTNICPTNTCETCNTCGIA